MAYVEAHAGLRDHPKTKKVARLLGVPRVQVIGHLLCLWWWCQEYAQDGNLSKYSQEDIADAADWPADATVFVEALISCGNKDQPGFLTIEADGALIVHDWYDYGGKLFVERKQGAARQAAWRARHTDITPGHDVTSVTNDDVTGSNALLTRDVTPSNAYRGEEIREEETRQEEKRVEETPAAKPPTPPLPKQVQVFLANGGKLRSGTLADGTSKKSQAIQFLSDRVTDDDVSLEFWGKVVNGYVNVQQWAATSYTVMVNDYYACGRIPGQATKTNGSCNGSGPRKQSNAEKALDMLRQKHAQEQGVIDGRSA